MYNFILNGCDTDSILISKEDGSEFSKEEQYKLINELNCLFPDKIIWEEDGYFNKVIYFKAKNYVLWDGKKIKTKGSALKASLKEKGLKDFIKESLDIFLYQDEYKENLLKLYNRYVMESQSLTSIKGWTFKKSITTKVQTSERSNESKVRDAIENSEYIEGDKCYMFFKSDDTLCLEENFDGDYNKDKLLEKLHNTMKIFSTVVDITLFPNYKLKRNKKQLQNLLDSGII